MTPVVAVSMFLVHLPVKIMFSFYRFIRNSDSMLVICNNEKLEQIDSIVKIKSAIFRCFISCNLFGNPFHCLVLFLVVGCLGFTIIISYLHYSFHHMLKECINYHDYALCRVKKI